MNVSQLEWIVTLGVTIAVLLFDVVYVGRRAHEPSDRASAALPDDLPRPAVAFGAWVWLLHGGQFGLEFFAGWLTEYSLSVDNLFLFMIIMASFNVPKDLPAAGASRRHRAGPGVPRHLHRRRRGGDNEFSWVFYIFGAVPDLHRLHLARDHDHDGDRENATTGWSASPAATWPRQSGQASSCTSGRPKRLMTPMFLVVVALATTDIVFAFDSIPAIYGLTSEPYLVFTANVFALMGLRQLYFLLGGLLKRLVYLSQGLAVILCFIGVKLLLHALHQNKLPFINGGLAVDVPEIPTLASLGVIVVVLIVTTVASLMKTRPAPRRRH